MKFPKKEFKNPIYKNFFLYSNFEAEELDRGTP